MYIIIENECIDTSIFTKMKLYEKSGIIAFIYKDPISGEDIELPVTFDDAFEAELAYDEILESYDHNEAAYVSNFGACVPSGLLLKMKKGQDISTIPSKEFAFNKNTDNKKAE